MTYIIALLGSVVYILLSMYCLHNLQLLSYRPKRGYLNVMTTRYYLLLCALQVVMFFLALLQWQYMFIVNYVLIIGGCVVMPSVSTKLSLVFTPRIIRQVVTLALMYFVLLLYVPLFLLPIFVPMVVLCAWAVNMPLEAIIAWYYIHKATNKLGSYHGTVIAITGSYGKTTVKTMLATLLCNAMASPNSYNTPLGIARFINTTNISDSRYLILEFGARQRGDIRRLCRLFRPTFGIITGISGCHLSTMGNIDNIIATKQELVKYLAVNDTVVLNGNDSEVASWVDMRCNRVLSDSVSCSIAKMSLEGSDVVLSINNTTRQLHLPLLGKANIDNYCLCIASIMAVGGDVDSAIERTVQLQPIPHRMQLINGAVPIVDDSYNCNMQGIISCCATMDAIDIDTKIIIVQGIVECGEQCCSINSEVGRIIAKTFDVIIATGINSDDIIKGAHQCPLCYKAKTLEESVTIASKHYTDSCVLVISNDIP